MNFVILIIAAILPTVAWLWFFHRFDQDPEPGGTVFRALIWGMAAVIPAGLLESPFRGFFQGEPNLLTIAILSFVVIAGIEELLKFLALRLAVWKSPEMDQPVDGVFYGITVGLGFAAVENILYAFTFGLAVIPIRALVTTVAHATFSGVAGYYLGLARFEPERARALQIQGLLLAVFLHGLYDFIILSGLIPPILSAVTVLFALRWLYGRVRKLQEDLV